MITLITTFFMATAFAFDIPKDSATRYDHVMKIWGDLVFEKRDNFMTQIKGTMRKDSDDGENISAKEYESLVKISKQKSIPEFKNVDSANRPENHSERRNLVQEACEKFKGQKYKRCEKKWFEIVDNESEEQDEISNTEWDQFQELLKKIHSSK